MIYEVCTLLAEHLRDGTSGVNNLRTSVPLAPTDLPLEPVTIVSEFEVPYLPFAHVPSEAYEDGPLVLVRRADDLGEYSAPGAPEILGDDSRIGVDVLVLFARRQTREIQQENACLSALLRVVRRSIGIWLEDLTPAERDLREVRVIQQLVPPRLVPTIGKIGQTDLVAGVIKLDLNVTDRWAENISSA